MRTTPLVGRTAWFGPRRLGWGLGPMTGEGWAATAVAVAVIGWLQRRGAPRWAPAAVTAAYLALVVLKGTAPGGPRARAELDHELDRRAAADGRVPPGSPALHQAHR